MNVGATFTMQKEAEVNVRIRTEQASSLVELPSADCCKAGERPINNLGSAVNADH